MKERLKDWWKRASIDPQAYVGHDADRNEAAVRRGSPPRPSAT